ncbi:MAG: isoamylase early set domain-containing protein [Candidatus Omnitrophica bacterium]|nr:isoamylase early set domain-containing protein [Candidatus Omnitrophota bacterium]
MVNHRRRDKETQKIQFEYFAPQVQKVLLAGNFNNWDAKRTPLKNDREGRWKVTLELPPGRYEYRYRVDDTWQNDQRPVECVPNAFGTWNCVITVH